MHSYEDALGLIRGLPRMAACMEAPLEEAIGHVLARDVTAPVPSPLFDNSAMDGFAVPTGAWREGEVWRVAGTLHAGSGDDVPRPADTANACVRIMTGSPMPDWCDAVVPVEQSESLPDGRVRLTGNPAPGAHVRRRGEDLRDGDVLLRAGRRLGAEEIMVAAAFGCGVLPVWRPPRFGMFVSGDELREPGQELARGQIYDSSKFYLLAAARAQGMMPSAMARLPDDPARAAQAMAPFLRVSPPEGGQILVTTGAVSRGEKDFIPGLANELGFTPLLHRAAIRPGKPIFIARRESTVWVGLPGNPISTNVGWHFFVRPLLDHCFGIRAPTPLWAPLAADCAKPEGLTCFFRAVHRDGAVRVLPGQGSAHFRASLEADGFAVLPAGTPARAGTPVAFLPTEAWLR